MPDKPARSDGASLPPKKRPPDDAKETDKPPEPEKRIERFPER
jgi:hypothetical protein